MEPTIAVSTRNPDHLLSFFVDYRAVDVADDVGMLAVTQRVVDAHGTIHVVIHAAGVADPTRIEDKDAALFKVVFTRV